MKTTGLTLFAVMGLLIVGVSVVTSTVFAHKGQGHGSTEIDVAAVVGHPSGVGVFGTSVLLRTHEGVAFTLDTMGLVPGNSHTLWLFIDENQDEVGNKALKAFEIRLWIDGEISDPDGNVRFSGFLPAGALPAVEVKKANDGSFDDPEGANILFLVRDHGPVQAGLEYDQMHFLNAVCPLPPDSCANTQEALHMGDHGRRDD